MHFELRFPSNSRLNWNPSEAGAVTVTDVVAVVEDDGWFVVVEEAVVPVAGAAAEASGGT